jgi:CBS domain-containing protein
MTDLRTYERAFWRLVADDPVNSLMRWPVACVEDTDSIVEVARALAANEVGVVLVLHHRTLVGVVSERDLAAQMATGGESTELTAADVMSPDLVTVLPETPILEAARIMHEAHVRHLPVVSDVVVAGIVSMRDLFDVLLRQADDRPRLRRSRLTTVEVDAISHARDAGHRHVPH